jgi:serine/threonine protein kinase
MAADNIDRTETGIVKGKFGYMAPEQVTDDELDRRSDVFSLGICLWELLTSERLFPGKANKETIRRVRQADVEPPATRRSELPAELDDIVMKALAKDRDDRFQSTEEMRLALLAFMSSAGHECGAQDLARYMREVFETELRKQPSPDVLVSEVARRLDEATGLEAFGELDPVSTVSTLSSTEQLEAPTVSAAPAAFDVSAASASSDSIDTPQPPEPPRGSQPAVPPMRPRRDSIVRAFQARFTDGESQPPAQIIDSPVPARPSPPPPRKTPPPPAIPVVARPRRATPTPLMVPLPGTMRERAARLPRWAPAALVAVLGLLVLWLAMRSRPGVVELHTKPADVVVIIDGQPVSGRSPFTLEDIEPGVRHEVLVSKPGHRPWSATFTVRAGETLRLPPVDLRPTKRGGGE